MKALNFIAGCCIIFLCMTLASARAGPEAPAVTPRPKRPHVVMFVIDDVGWTDVGYRNGSGMLTPFFDKMASTGILLNQYYVQPVCSPSRSAFMLGRYPFHTGLQHFNTIMPTSKAHMPLNQSTMAELLNQAGYQSHMVGKWHLGYADWAYTPTERGFRSHVGYFQGMEDYYTKNFSVPHKYISANITGLDWWRNKTADKKDAGTYNLDLFDAEVQHLLDTYTFDQDHPLFLYMAHQIVHIPLEVPEQYKQRCSHITDPNRQTYCGMMAALDDSFQRFVAAFQAKGLWDDTLLIVTTDNGGDPNYGDFPASAGCNYPLRAGKGTVFEGGVRAVGFLHGGKNVIPDHVRGTESNELMHAVDWMPTIVNIVNAAAEHDSSVPSVTPPSNLDGVDVWDVLINGKPTSRQDIPLNINYNVSYPDAGVQVGIRKGDYKLVIDQVTGNTLNYDGWFPPPPAAKIPAPPNKSGMFLFNLADDPNEYNNLYDSEPAVVQEMKELLAKYMETYQPPQPNAFDFAGIPRLHDGVWAPFL